MVAPTGRDYCCPRCQSVLRTRSAEESGIAEGSASREPRDAPQRDATWDADFDAWQTNERLRHAERVLARGRRRTTRTADVVRFDPPSGMAVRPSEPALPPLAATPSAPISPWGWLLICGGTTGLTCGGVLMLWSQIAQRADLWNIGLPMLVGGQMILCLGLACQWTLTRPETTEAGPDMSGPTQRSTTRQSPRRGE